MAVPTKPTMLYYNQNEGFDSPTNFKRLQQNTVYLVDYANALKSVLTAYEQQIDYMTEQADKLQADEETEVIR